MQIPVLRIGTRSSALALAQAEEVRTRLMQMHTLPSSAFEIIAMSTAGDRIMNASLSAFGGKGLFTREIEIALKEGRIDVAVHSTKDMPTVLPDGLHLSVYLKREDPRDAFIGKAVSHLRDLPYGATIGSSSKRRKALVRKIRPDLKIVPCRGNIGTRLSRLKETKMDGTFLALAGLRRLHLQAVATEILEPEFFLPAPGQGALVIESRVSDSNIDAFIRPLADIATHYEMACERMFLSRLDGSCCTPLGGLARVRGDDIYFMSMIITQDGRISHEFRLHGSVEDAEDIGQQAAEQLKKDAGFAFFEGWV
ncbi:MAG: hydroxymethylbilane synthase [Candidatus Tokpelaia sp. JSC161]|jgi:hydroxymethylbilane synthase|nr:MAG: hydroxymethylbilane synthase [Candidatus Tokpelaia sp. JSC161]